MKSQKLEICPYFCQKSTRIFTKMSLYEEFGHPGKGLLRPLCVKWVKLVRGPFRRAAQTLVREGSKKRKALLIGPCYYWPRPPHPLVGPWDFEIWRPNLNDAVDATGPETDFTLETDGKFVRKTNEHSFKSQISPLRPIKNEKNIKWYTVWLILHQGSFL